MYIFSFSHPEVQRASLSRIVRGRVGYLSAYTRSGIYSIDDKGWRGNFLLSAGEQWLKHELTKNFKVIRDLELLPQLLGQDL